MKQKALVVLLLLTFIFSFGIPVLAQPGELRPATGTLQIVSVQDVAAAQDERARPGFTPELGPAQDLHPASIIVTYDSSVTPEGLAALIGGRVVHQYQNVFRGASLLVQPAQMNTLAGLSGITGIYVDEVLKIDTDHSPAFIGAPAVWSQLGGQENAGEGVVVGVIDTGIWPEHPSFSDPDPSGKPYAAPPGGPYVCDFGNTGWNPDDAPFTCNNKLIGAYTFLDTYKTQVPGGLDPAEYDSARDGDGHGSHTASTAAGNAGVAASILGTGFGNVSGMAPRAQIIAYRICAGEQGSCYSSDAIAAIDQAIADGVDVINYSIGGGSNPYNDLVSQAFLSAYQNGIFVAASGGNSGPSPDTVSHREPWVTTVAASTQSRTFSGTIHLSASNSDTLDLTGVSIGGTVSGEVVLGATYGNELCGSVTGVNPFPPGTFSANQIVVCKRGITARVEKSANVQAAGAGGMILYNADTNSLSADNHFVPTVHITDVDGAALLNFLNTHTGEQANLTGGVVAFEAGDFMAAFSSRGGPQQLLGISKPDLTAPGVNILAANSPNPSFPVTGGTGLPGQFFHALAGTSMSSPHVAGSAALLKDLHPGWSPGQIKSALMMSARTTGVFKEDGITPADPFDYGSGRLDLSNGGFPGLTISAFPGDFVDHENDLWTVNYPSLFIPNMPDQLTVQRTVHSELGSSAQWTINVTTPPDLLITVPGSITVGAGANQTFSITVDAHLLPSATVRHASLTFTHDGQSLHFPITVVRSQPVVTLEKDCSPAILMVDQDTHCTIRLENQSFTASTITVTDILPDRLTLDPTSVVGATAINAYSIGYQGALVQKSLQAINVVDAAGQTPAGYTPLSSYGIPPIGGVTDEYNLTLNVDPYIYAGKSYTIIEMISNGFAVVGGGFANVSYNNQFLPSTPQPNNVLAPFWTDLNPAAGGYLRVAYITDGALTWLVLDWENVRVYQEAETNSFQIWIGVNGEEDISFTYGNVGNGRLGKQTVGAENENGTIGSTWRYNQLLQIPAGTELRVASTFNPGGTHLISFNARGNQAGSWTNCATVTTAPVQGFSTDCISGSVLEFPTLFLPFMAR